MTIPLVSVILATYNGSRFLSEAIESVLAQDYPYLELIVIDDASTDERVYQIVGDYIQKDERVQYEKNPRNMERSWSKNHGVELSRGEYIAFIDDDDVWENTKLSKQIQIFSRDRDIGIVGTWAQFVDESGKIIGITTHLKSTPEQIHDAILLSNQFIQSSILVRKDVFLQAGGFPGFNLCEDYDLLCRILQVSQGYNISEPLIRYRVRASSTTTKNLYRMKWITIKLVWRYRKNFPNAFGALVLRWVTFPFDISSLFHLWKTISQKKSL